MRAIRGVSVVCLTLTALMLLAAAPASLVLASDGGGPQRAAVPVLKQLTYSADIAGPYARTQITALLVNPSTDKANHTFVFVVPQGALMSNFSLTVDGVVYYAEVLEKQTAEEKYKTAVDDGRTAGLLASLGDSLFTYGVSLSPGETVEVSLAYEQLLLKANGRYRYELDLTADPKPLKAGTMHLSVDVRSTSEDTEVTTSGYDDSMNVQETSSSSFVVTNERAPFVPSEDVAVEWATVPGALEGEMLFGQHEGMGYFVHIFGPDPSSESGEVLPKDFVFVVDKSGSMSRTKMGQAKEGVDVIYSSLDVEDRFSLVKFDTSWQAYSSKLVRATKEEVAKLRTYVQSISSGGGTNIHSAMIAALDIFKAAEEPVPIIVLLSDGRANSGLYARSEFRQDVLEKNTVDASIYCIALGSNADWNFLEAMALENHGAAIWVGEDEDVPTAIASFVRSFSSPVLSGISFEYGPEVVDVMPTSVRAHYAGSEVLVTGRFLLPSGPIRATMFSRGVDGPVTSEHSFGLPGTLDDGVVARMWALHRIKSLEDRMKWDGEDNETIRQVIDLAIEFNLATERTSMLVELPEGLEGRFGVPSLDAQSNGDSDSSNLSYSSRLGLRSPSSPNADPSSFQQANPDSTRASPSPAPPMGEGAALGGPSGVGLLLLLCVGTAIVIVVTVAALLWARDGRGGRRSKGS